MENYPYSYPDSHDSSPRSQSNETWDDQQQQQQSQSGNYKVKFMISYNGKILPRPHDNQLAYVGGETKILALDRSIRFSAMVGKLSSFASADEIAFKYQLPGEDLDALISVTNDEDLEHMMAEYDRLYRSTANSGAKPARLRLFLFPVNNSNQSSFSGDDPKPNQQWFVDALNAVPVSVPDGSSPPASASNPGDFLFGFEKSPGPAPAPAAVAPVPAPLKQEEKIGSEERVVGDPMYEIHRQIQDLQRLQIQEQKQQQQQLQQAMMQRSNEANIRANFHGDYYMQEKPAAAAGVPVSVAPAGYWQERNAPVSGGYSDQISSIERQQQQQHQQHQHNIQQQQQQQQHLHQQQQQQQQHQQQQLYMIHSQAYQTPVTNVRQVAGQVGHTGQGYYGIQQPRVVPDVYREQPVYTMGPPQVQQQPHPQMKMMVGEMGSGGGGSAGYTTQVGYDSTGRQVYYATPPAQGGGVVPSYQPAVSADPRQQQESKVVKPPQAS